MYKTHEDHTIPVGLGGDGETWNGTDRPGLEHLGRNVNNYT